MKIIDTTTFFEEHLMMDLRFNILNAFVDHFIVCEARFTHSGKEKEINFNKSDYPEFEDKITHLIIDKEPENIIKKDNLEIHEQRVNSVFRINAQRDYILKSLQDYSAEDYIIHSDNDEIPNLEAIDLKKNKSKIVIFKQSLFYYKFDLYLPNIDWFGSKCCQLKNLKSINLLRAAKNRKYNFFRLDTMFSDIKHSSVNIIKDGGWHFSNLKNLEELERKYKNDENHAEYEYFGHSINKIKNNLDNRTIDYNHNVKKDSLDRFGSTKLKNVDLSILPKFLQDNKKKYIDWFDLT